MADNHPDTASLPSRGVRNGMWKKCVWLPLVLVFILAVEAWHLWGWRVGELRFHESWTPEQRAELQALDDYLLKEPMRALIIDEFYEDCSEEDDEEVEADDDDDDDEEEEEENDDEEDDDEEADDEVEADDDDEEDEEEYLNLEENEYFVRSQSKFPWLYLCKSVELRDWLTHARQNLKETAAKGYQPKAQRHTTAAHQAARHGKAALLRKLVKQEADPNAWDDILQQTVFTAAIAGLPYADHAPLPIQEKLELLGFLLSHGVNMDERRNDVLVAAIEASGNDFNDKGKTLEWVISHGFSPQTWEDWNDIIYALMRNNEMREMTQRLIKQGKLTPDQDAVALMLHVALQTAVWGGEMKETLQWLLDELHADPNATLPEQSRSIISGYVSQLLANKLYSTEKEITRHLDYLEMLLAHGAHIAPEDINALRLKAKALHECFEDPFEK